MARETRRIGIRTAQVRLPATQSVGPALVRTAASFADREFAKAADIKTQEAIVAAGALNFERDGEGNLIAPTVPIGDNGLIAPSIYDRKYTQMVGQRYLQQMSIDVSEQLNIIASENSFEPETFRTLAEGFVAKVTELAPDYLKPDVNNTAQVKMVEHGMDKDGNDTVDKTDFSPQFETNSRGVGILTALAERPLGEEGKT